MQQLENYDYGTMTKQKGTIKNRKKMKGKGWTVTVWKVSKNGVFPDPYLVPVQKNTHQKKFCIWTLFTKSILLRKWRKVTKNIDWYRGLSEEEKVRKEDTLEISTRMCLKKTKEILNKT